MFDLGFMELLVVGIIGLLVLGPERLPVAVRTVGLTIGRIKRGFADVQAQVEREIGADEIRQQLHNENIMKNLAKQEREQAKPDAEPAAATPAVDEAPKRPLSNVRRSAPPVAPVVQPAPAAASEPAADSTESSDAPGPATAAPEPAVEEPSNRPHER